MSGSFDNYTGWACYSGSVNCISCTRQRYYVNGIHKFDGDPGIIGMGRSFFEDGIDGIYKSTVFENHYHNDKIGLIYTGPFTSSFYGN